MFCRIHDMVVGNGTEFWKHDFPGIRHVFEFGPCFVCRGSKVSEHGRYLVDIAFALEKRGSFEALPDDTPDRPQIDPFGVVMGPEKELGGAVPSGGDLVGVGAA